MTDAQYQQVILTETGYSTDPVVSNQITTWWQVQLDNGRSGYKAYLFTKATVLRYTLAIFRRMRDVVIGPDQIRASVLFKNAKDEYDEWIAFVKTEDPTYGIAAFETSAPISRADMLDTVMDEKQFIEEFGIPFAQSPFLINR